VRSDRCWQQGPAGAVWPLAGETSDIVHVRRGGGIRTIAQNIDGNLKGIKASERRALERTYRRRVARSEVVSAELARHL